MQGQNQRFLLATHWIEYTEWDGIAEATAEVALGNGRELLLELIPTERADENAGGASMMLAYRTVSRLGAWRESLQGLGWFFRSPKFALALVSLVAIAGVLGTVKYRRASVAVMNLIFTLDGIGDLEKELESNVDPENAEDARLRINWNRVFCNGLRLTAYRMAVVTLVTRFQHWIALLVKEAGVIVSKKRNDPSMLMVQLEALNTLLGDGPIPLKFFDELEEVRNSVIHADSQAKWESMPGKQRKVVDAYRNSSGEVEISENQFQAAVDAMMAQVVWYRSKIAAESQP